MSEFFFFFFYNCRLELSDTLSCLKWLWNLHPLFQSCPWEAQPGDCLPLHKLSPQTWWGFWRLKSCGLIPKISSFFEGSQTSSKRACGRTSAINRLHWYWTGKPLGLCTDIHLIMLNFSHKYRYRPKKDGKDFLGNTSPSIFSLQWLRTVWNLTIWDTNMLFTLIIPFLLRFASL